MTQISSNPIAERLGELVDQWSTFAEGRDARLLVWRATGGELGMVEAFFAQETDAAACATPDFFLRFTCPFENPRAHGYALREELIAQYDAIRPQLEAESIEAGWHCPPHRGEADDIAALVSALVSFHAHHAERIERLAVWLDPSSLTSPEAFATWLLRLVQAADAQLRFLVVNTDDALETLLRGDPARIRLSACDLEMPAAVLALAEDADDGSPGGQLRTLLVKLGAAASDDVQRAEALARTATALANAQGWPQHAAIVQIMLAGAYGAVERHVDALACYAEAERYGETMEQAALATAGSPEDDPNALRVARQVRLQARLGQGATLIANGTWQHAASVYLAASAFAEANADTALWHDTLRLASFCYERASEPEKAWDCGLRALSVGASMAAEERKSSTLPYLFVHLLRMTERPSYAAHGDAIAQSAERLLGPTWRDTLQGAR